MPVSKNFLNNLNKNRERMVARFRGADIVFYYIYLHNTVRHFKVENSCLNTV